MYFKKTIVIEAVFQVAFENVILILKKSIEKVLYLLYFYVTDYK